MEQEGRSVVSRAGLLCFLTGIVLSRLSLGSLFFTLPLLIFAPQIKKTSTAVILQLICGLAAIVWILVDYKDVLSDPQYYGIVGFSLFLPVCLIVTSVVWTGLRNYSRLILRKLVICSLPVGLIGLGFSLWLSSEAGLSAYQLIVAYLQQLFPEVLAEQIDLELISQVFVTFILVAAAPMGVALGSLPVLISEVIIHKQDEQWQEDFSDMGMPSVFSWPTLGLWIVALCGSLFIELPVWLTVIVWNSALCLTLHYLLAGISILSARVRKKVPEVRASKVCVICLVMCLIPGTNLLVLIGFPVLGLLETWIRFR